VVAPLEPGLWQGLLEHRNKNLEALESDLLTHAMNIFQELLDAKKPKGDSAVVQAAKEDSGFLTNLTTKVLDNVQISIKNIHVRYEDPDFRKRWPLAMGLTLQAIRMYTTDESGKECFIDRTLPANKGEPIRKVLELRNFGIYCRPRDDAGNLLGRVLDVSQ